MLSVLVVDDDKTTAATLKDTLLQGGFRVIKTTSFEEARDVIAEEHFDAAFVDVILEQGETRGRKKPERPLGLRICETVRKRFPQCWIVVYSRLVDEDSKFDRDQFRKAGADDVRGSNWVTWLSSAEVKQYVEEGVRKKDTEADAARPVIPEDEWRTNAAVELLTHPTLRKIVRSAVPEGDEDSVSALSGGYSGAVVLRVHTTRNSSGRVPLSTIVKVSRASHPLDLEVQGAPETGAPLDFVSVRASHASEAPIDGWFYISSSALNDADSLKKLLVSERETTSRVEKAASAVVDEILTPIVSHSLLVSGDGGGRQDLRLSYRMAVELDDVLMELERCRPYVTKTDLDTFNLVRKFLKYGTKENWSLSQHSPYFGFAHGDLHTENILIAKNDRVFLIDFARSKRMPRLFDVSSLLVDLWLRILDASDMGEWQWERVPLWVAAIQGFSPFVSTTNAVAESTPEHSPAWEFLSAEICRYLSGIAPSVGTNELAQAVLFQLLRFARFPSITMPKKLLAMHLASRLLEDLRITDRL